MPARITAKLNTIVLYAKDPKTTAEFYRRFFDFKILHNTTDDLIELTLKDGAKILVLQAAKSIKLGQVKIKLVFDVRDVEKFKRRSKNLGLEFGGTHQANGYCFANTKDPDKNSVSVSSRAYR